MTESAFEPDMTGNGSNGHAPARPDDNDLNRFLEDALGSVLRSARESAAEMMERAKQAADEEVSRTKELHDAAQAEVDRMTAWRARVEPLVDAANETAEAIQRAVSDVPGRVAEALAPVNEALANMDEVMGRLTEALRPPSDGPGGPGGPGDGSRSFGAPGDDPAADQPIRERVGVVATQADAQTASTSEPEDGTNPGGQDAAGVAASAQAPDAAGTEAAPPAVPSDPTWVDWSWNGKGTAPIAGAAGAPANGAGGDLGSDDDEVALRSATTQLRRAVTDIDWRDLPSASHG